MKQTEKKRRARTENLPRTLWPGTTGKGKAIFRVVSGNFLEMFNFMIYSLTTATFGGLTPAACTYL